MRRRRLVTIGASVLAVVGLGALAVGDYVYRTGTTVPCAINDDDLANSLASFETPGPGNGPFPGEGWDRWVGHDLSAWWLPDVAVEEVTVPVADDVTLSAWWVPAPGGSDGRTVIVTHGYGTSRRDFNTLLPAAMLVRGGFDVLLVDQRDTGESTCDDGRHSAGQEESDDFAAVARWLVTERGVDADRLGMYGVSGGAIATAILPAKTGDVAAFALEAPMFDFDAAARAEVEFQGFPGFLWQLANTAARLRGVDLNATPITAGIEAAADRPILLLHGDADQRIAYANALAFVDHASGAGVPVRLETFEGADHTEGMLTETDRYARALTAFFDAALAG
jgi:dipeptidyl aminopeptidase/acylaminoacyl peptidase